MSHRPLTSRRRYKEYRRALKAHETEGSSRTAAAHTKRKGRGAQRNFLELFTAFLGLLHGIRGLVAFSLLTVTIATGLKLIPPAATGFRVRSRLEQYLRDLHDVVGQRLTNGVAGYVVKKCRSVEVSIVRS